MPTPVVSPYLVLGVPRTATAAAIRSAFRAAARLQHPDRGGSASEFAQLRAAFEVGSTPWNPRELLISL